jgi:hypothetical protein
VPYAIVFRKHSEIVSNVPWKASFTSAKRHAQDHFRTHQKGSGATHAEVVNTDTGKVMYSYPRILNAQGT